MARACVACVPSARSSSNPGHKGWGATYCAAELGISLVWPWAACWWAAGLCWMDAAEALMRGSAQVAREWHACGARVRALGAIPLLCLDC